MKMNKKGFTLAELLIVIAIIAILIAIAIPVFSGQLENAKRQADHANLRSAYSLVQTASLVGGKTAGFPTGTTAYFGTNGTPVSDASDAAKLQGKNLHKRSAAAVPEGAGPVTGEASCDACVVNCEKYNTADNIQFTRANADDDYGWKLALLS